ncbi:MAG: PIG-L family deacetylase, partial [Chloroflexi bacterium]|nr:PIG-L family deacetylase [Chloroflexota bacterium]
MEIDFKTAMVIAAHPDDSEFNCAGTVAQWVDQGVDVTYVVLSRGDKGSGDRLMTPELLAAMRESEQRAAACYLGVKQVAFLDFRDGEIWDSPTARERVVRAIRTYRPEAVLTHDPATYYHGDLFLNHPDHKATGDIALAAIYPLARDHMHFPEHLAEGLE